MKRANSLIVVTALLVFTSGFSFQSQAQWQKGSGNIGRETRDLPAYDKIDAGGVAEVRLSQGPEQVTEVETDENLLPFIKTTVEDGTLNISTEKIRDYSKLVIHVTLPDLSYINASGASHITGVTPFEISYLMIEGSGATEIEMELIVETLESDLSGAAEMKLKGTANSHNSEISGAASLKAFDLETQTTSISASGAANGEVTALKELDLETSGAAEVQYSKEPETLITNPQEGYVKEPSSEGVIVIHSDDWDDETEVKVGGVSVNVKDDDTVTIKLGNKVLIIDEDGHVEFHKTKAHKFNGHWGGFHLGINGYVDPDFSTQVPPEYNFLDLKYEQSIDVHINAYEQNFNLVKNHLGLITGIGFTFNSYRYGKDWHFVSDTATIYAFHGEDVYPERDYQKSKMKVTYLNIPLLLEYQTNHGMKTNSFHITAGVMGGVRLGTKAKVVWGEDNSKEKNWDDYHMNPFRWDAYAGIGWGIINIYATYSMNPLFQEDEGPELYPFSIGLALINW